jgi:hypothetical protein
MGAPRIAGMKAAFVFEVCVWPIALVYDGGLSKRSPVLRISRSRTFYRKSQRISATMPFVYQHVSESGTSPEKAAGYQTGRRRLIITIMTAEKSFRSL